MKKTGFLFCMVMAFLTLKTEGQDFIFDFRLDFEGWTGDFADYPEGDSVFYELEFKRNPLPLPLDQNRFSLMLSGKNHSDDLFMFIKRKISGLIPDHDYMVRFTIELASKAPTNAIGIGGAPGESVFLKAGATRIEPLKNENQGFFLMNIDKGNQAAPGADMDTLGHIGVADETEDYTLITRSNENHPFMIRTDMEGSLWVCIGTDSGFEGKTTLYYSHIHIRFEDALDVDYQTVSPDPVVYPNPASDLIFIDSNDLEISRVELIGPDGRLKKTTIENGRIDLRNMVPGLYMVRITYRNGHIANRPVLVL